MTKDQLDAIRARCAAATPGPWHWTYDGSSDWSVFIHDFEGGEADRIASVYRYHATECPDVEFIAHARSDVPALLAEVHRLRELVEAAFEEGMAEGLADERALGRGVTWENSDAKRLLDGGTE